MPVTIPDWLPGGGTVIGPPDAQTPAADTSQRDQLIKNLADQHRGQVGGASQVLTKDAEGKDQHYYDKYTFGDGTSIEIAPTGQVQNYVPKTDKTAAAVPGYTDITQVRNENQSITYYGRDPADGQMKPVPGLPVSAAPASATKTPSPLGQMDKIDKNGNDATKSGLPAISLRDPATGTVIDVPKDPAGTVTPVGDNFYVIKPDGSSTLVTDSAGKPIAKTKDPSQFNVPGIGLVNYDPSTGNANVLIAAPKGLQANQLKPEVRGGKTYVPVDDGKGGITWQETNLPSDTTYSVAANDSRSPNITLIDAQGNTKTIPKEGWTPPPVPNVGQVQQADLVASNIAVTQPDGSIKWVPNTNQVSVSDAQRQLIQGLGIQVASGSMTEAAAKDVIASATTIMNAQAAKTNAEANAQQQIQQGAQAALQGIQQGAATGAGVLQNRVTNAQQMLSGVLGIAGQGQRSGNMGGGLMNVPAGLGGQLVSGIQGWATELGGGPDVYQSAANLVRRADPGSNLGGDAATAYGALGQMLQKYRDMTGQPHPAEQIANAAQPNTGFAAPATAAAATPVAPAATFAPGSFTGPAPSLPAGPTGAAINQVPGSNYGTSYNTAQLNGQRWPNPQPLPAGTQVPYSTTSNPWFVAPVTVAPPEATVTV